MHYISSGVVKKAVFVNICPTEFIFILVYLTQKADLQVKTGLTGKKLLLN